MLVLILHLLWPGPRGWRHREESRTAPSRDAEHLATQRASNNAGQGQAASDQHQTVPTTPRWCCSNGPGLEMRILMSEASVLSETGCCFSSRPRAVTLQGRQRGG